LVSALWKAALITPADCHSVEELGFQHLDRRDGALLQGGAVGSSGPLYTFGAGLLVPPTEYQVTAFLSSVGDLVLSLFNRGPGTLPLSGTMGSAESLCTLGGNYPGRCRVVDCHSKEEMRL
jgi:hypothetical protein